MNASDGAGPLSDQARRWTPMDADQKRGRAVATTRTAVGAPLRRYVFRLKTPDPVAGVQRVTPPLRNRDGPLREPQGRPQPRMNANERESIEPDWRPFASIRGLPDFHALRMSEAKHVPHTPAAKCQPRCRSSSVSICGKKPFSSVVATPSVPITRQRRMLVLHQT